MFINISNHSTLPSKHDETQKNQKKKKKTKQNKTYFQAYITCK